MFPEMCKGAMGQMMNIGCQNGTGKYITPVDADIVYEKFEIEANTLFGDYQDCNPLLKGPKAGVFACEGDSGQANCSCAAATPATDCACDRVFAPIGRQTTGDGPQVPCSNISTANKCNSTGGFDSSCQWNKLSDQCAPFGCSNLTTMGGEAACSKNWDCMWLGDKCQEYECKNNDKAACEMAAGSYPLGHFCTLDKATGKCGGGFNDNSNPTMEWRDTVMDMMDGYWYSTNSDGYCGHKGGPDAAAEDMVAAAAEPCTWRISAITKVANKTCVNDKIMDHVIQKNNTCFGELPDPQNRSTDGFINCFFNALLGNKTSGQAGIAPTLDAVAAEVGQLFEDGFKSVADGGCPWSGSASDHQDIDRSHVSTGVSSEALYVIGGPAQVAELANRNAADAAGLLWQLRAHREQQPQEEHWSGLALSELSITPVTVELNTLFGQYGICHKGACNATWDCFCQSQWGDHKGPYCEGDSGDSDDDCSCLLMGGCTPSMFGPATKARFVGHKAAGPGASGGHLYSFQEGGECDGKKELCSWAKTSSVDEETAAPAACVAAQVLDRGVEMAAAVRHCAGAQ